MKGGQSREVGSRVSQRDGAEERRDARANKGGLEGWGFGGAKVSSDKVMVTKSDGKGLGWVAEKTFDGEAADLDVSVADGVKKGGVGRGAESTRDVGSEGGIFKI